MGDRSILPAPLYDLPKMIADTVGLGKALMAMEPNLDNRGLKPTVSTIEWHDMLWNSLLSYLILSINHASPILSNELSNTYLISVWLL